MELVDIPLANYMSPSFGANPVQLGPVGANTIAETEEIEQIEQLLLLGNKCLDENNVQSAIKLFSEALEIDSFNASLLTARANAFVLNEQFEKALIDANALLNTFNNEKEVQLQALLLIANIHRAQGDNETALEFALKLLLMEPEELQTKVEQSVFEICRELLNIEQSEGFEVGVSVFEQMQHYANLLFSGQKFAPAQSLIECLIHLESSVPQDVLTRALLTGARIMWEQRNLERAVATYHECIIRAWRLQLVSVESEARYELGTIYFNMKQFFQAASSFEKYLCLLELRLPGPNDTTRVVEKNLDVIAKKVDALCAISECFLELQEMDLAESNARALQVLAAEVENETDDPEPTAEKVQGTSREITCRQCYLLCRIMKKKRNFCEAQKYAHTFLELSKRSQYKLHESLLICGSIERKLENFAVSLEHFNDLLSLCLNEVQNATKQHSAALERLCTTLYKLGKLNFEIKDFTSAAKYLEDCVKQSKKVGENRDLECKALILLAKCNLAQGHPAEAIHSLNVGLAMQKSISAAIYRRCMVKSAVAVQSVGSKSELEGARSLLEEVIGDFEQEALHVFARDSHFNNKEYRVLEEVSNAYVNILVKLSHLQAALLACESFRRFKLCAYFSQRSELAGRNCENYRKILQNKVTLEYFQACVDEQESPILYFHLSEEALFIWLLSSAKGVQSFHKHTKESSESSMYEMLEMFYHSLASRNSGLYGFENRIILNSKSLVKILPKMDSDEIEARIEKDVCHYIFDPMKKELKKLQSARKLFFISNGLLGMAPFQEMFRKFWQQNITLECPTTESFTSVQMMHWANYSADNKEHETPFNAALMQADNRSKKDSQEERQRKMDESVSVSRSGTAANLLGWTNLSEGLNAGLKEVPSLQYKRQIESASGDKADLSSMYKGINPALDKLGYDQVALDRLSYGLDNESLKTDASSVKYGAGASLSSGKGQRRGTVVKLDTEATRNNLKGNDKSNSSPMSNHQHSDNLSAISQLSSADSKQNDRLKTYRRIEQSFSTIISKTWNEKHVRSSSIAVETYSPAIENKLFRFIGAPVMPTSVKFPMFTWKPLKNLRFAQEELKVCSHYFRDTALMGEQCTKDDALRAIVQSTCLHVATHMSYESCTLAFTPNVLYQQMKSVDHEVCCVELRDLLDLNLSHIKLLVLSSFPTQRHEHYSSFFNLITLMLALGVQCVVYSSHAIATDSVTKFWHYFYRAIRKIDPKCHISAALDYAKAHMQKDPKYASPEHWKGMQFAGKDVAIDGKAMIHDMLDQVVDQMEKTNADDCLNVVNDKSQGMPLLNTQQSLQQLRRHLAELIMDNMSQLDVLDPLFYLVLRGLDASIQGVQNIDLQRIEDYRLIGNKKILLFLHFLRFDFQPYGSTDDKEGNLRPIIVFPHWDKNSLLKPACEVLRNLILIRDNEKILEELCAVLTFDSANCNDVVMDETNASSSLNPVDLVSLVIDVLSLSEHAPDVEMFISDGGVRKVWQCAASRRLLTAIGFHQVDFALLPYRNLANIRYQQSVLKILCALSG